MPTDSKLAAAILAGSPTGPQALATATAPVLYGLALRFTHDAQAARALVLSVLRTALRELPLVRCEGPIAPWLFGIAAEACLRLPPAPPLVLSTFDRALWQLAPRDRLAFLLHDGAGLSRADVAWIFDEPATEVGARVHRARLALCPCVAALEPAAPAPDQA